MSKNYIGNNALKTGEGRLPKCNTKASNRALLRKASGSDASKRWHCSDMNWVLSGSNCGEHLSAIDGAVLLTIARLLSSQAHESRPATLEGLLTQDYIAKRTYGHSVQTIRRSSVKLESLGIITRRHHRAGQNRTRIHYTLHVDRVYQLIEDWGSVDEPQEQTQSNTPSKPRKSQVAAHISGEERGRVHDKCKELAQKVVDCTKARTPRKMRKALTRNWYRSALKACENGEPVNEIVRALEHAIWRVDTGQIRYWNGLWMYDELAKMREKRAERKREEELGRNTGSSSPPSSEHLIIEPQDISEGFFKFGADL